MAQEDRIDLCIRGAGPAGSAAAEHARRQGARVVLIEAGEIGGVSHNWGTLPAQALAASAARAHAIRTARDVGLDALDPRINFGRVNAHLRAVIETAGLDISSQRLAAQGIEVLKGRARFVSPHALEADGRTIRARRFLIATGSRPLVPDIPGAAQSGYLTPETIFEITRRPAHLLVVGAGATGLALAQAHLRLGCAVTVIDMLDPLVGHDPELVEAVMRRLRGEGMEIHANTGVVSIARDGDEIALEIKSGANEARLLGSHLLFATGRSPDFDDLGLDAAKVHSDGPALVLKRGGRTSNPRIWAAGDAAATWGAHAARHGAISAVEDMFGRANRRSLVPVLVHTDPQIASVGLEEREARARYRDRLGIYRTGLGQTDAARAAGQTHGHLKVLTDPRGRLVGAALVGPHAAELITVLALAITQNLTLADLGQMVVPHPAHAQAIVNLAQVHGEAKPRSAQPAWLTRVKRLLP